MIGAIADAKRVVPAAAAHRRAATEKEQHNMLYRARLVDDLAGMDQEVLVKLRDGAETSAERIVDAVDRVHPLAGKAGWWTAYRIRHFLPLPMQLRVELDLSRPRRLAELRRLSISVDLFGRENLEAALRSGSIDEIDSFRRRAKREINWLERALVKLRQQERRLLVRYVDEMTTPRAERKQGSSLPALDWLAAEVAVLAKRRELLSLLAATPTQQKREHTIQVPRYGRSPERRKLRFPGKDEPPRPAVPSPFARHDKKAEPPPPANEDSVSDPIAEQAQRQRYRVTISRADGRVRHLRVHLSNIESAVAIISDLVSQGAGLGESATVTRVERESHRIQLLLSPPGGARRRSANTGETLVTIHLMPTIRSSRDSADDPAIAAAARKWARDPSHQPS